jgi:type III restriction enzyme
MLEDINRAKIVITNYHAFKLPRAARALRRRTALLQGRTGPELQTLETEGQMLQRVMPDLMGMKNILVLNDEAHHCYREKPPDPDDEDAEGRRAEGSREEQRGRPPVDLRPRSVNRKLGLPASSTCRRRRSSCAAPATPRARCSPGR